MQRWHMFGIGIILVLLVIFPRVLDLDSFRSPDEDRWMANTNGFVTKLAHGRLAELVQQPHPGITTQWLGALTIRYESWETRKLPLVIGQSLLILLIGYVFGRLWGKTAGVFTIITLATNPLLYAHTRVYAMDSLLALFSVLSLGFLLLWHKEQGQPLSWRYLVASAFCAAAAILSKLPGVALLPIITGVFIYWGWKEKKLQATSYLPRRQAGKLPATWLLAFLISLAIILPSFAIAPMHVIGDFTEFFRSDDYQELHQLGNYYYLGSLVFFSTPLHWAALAVLVWLAIKKKLSRLESEQILILLAFAVLLVVQMTLGAKKGDRYILPSFAVLDVVAAWTIASSISHTALRIKKLSVAQCLMLAAIVWQAWIIWQTHPHTLAYVNPLTRPWFGDRRHGWGEGLDLAAAYLNQKPRAADLKVATFYPTEFAPYFHGEAVPAHQYENESVDYVIVYRAMFERGDSWETDVVNHYKNQPPEKIIELSGLPIVWIYIRQ